MSMRRYRSDDRDLDGHDLDLFIRSPEGNGDWYIGVCDHDARGSRHAVRVTTSGTPNGQHGACVAIAHLWRALGGESFPGFSTRGVSAEAPVTSADHVTEEELAEIDLDAANLADPTYGAANFARRQGAEERLARRAPRLAADLRAERARREGAEMRLAELRAEIEAMRQGGSR
jgi:hypothetical protein